MDCIINSLLLMFWARQPRRKNQKKEQVENENFSSFPSIFLIYPSKAAYIKTANIISHWRMKIFHEYSSLLCNHGSRMKKCYLNSLKICFTTGGVEETSWKKFFIIPGVGI
jgi:hypothetical protein